MRQQPARLLIKRDPAAAMPARFNAAGNSFRPTKPVLNAGPEQWHGVEAGGQASPPELWDAAYAMYEDGAGSFVEPDLEQPWNVPLRQRNRGLFAGGPAGQDRGAVNGQSSLFPKGQGFAWHSGDGYAQLEKAQSRLTRHNAVRAAIFDVGFDLNHRSIPRKLLPGRNFADGDPNDVTDKDTGGFLENPGHGTATMALLAGKQLQGMKDPRQNGHVIGGAPDAEVVPIRIAKSVVLLATSAFAAALGHVIDHENVDVVSMSMGGVASQAWAGAVNLAYERGIFLVTAAGKTILFGRP
jgi:hypothetical protein